MYDQRLKQLIKSIDPQEWEIELKDELFLIFLEKYKDDNHNSVYHLLFNKKMDNEGIYKINKIVELLIKHGIPAFVINNKNQLPTDLSADKSLYATEILKNQISLESNILFNETMDTMD